MSDSCVEQRLAELLEADADSGPADRDRRIAETLHPAVDVRFFD